MRALALGMTAQGNSLRSMKMIPREITKRPDYVYPVPQNVPNVSAGMNVLDFPEGPRPIATDVSPWYGVYPPISGGGWRNGSTPAFSRRLKSNKKHSTRN